MLTDWFITKMNGTDRIRCAFTVVDYSGDSPVQVRPSTQTVVVTDDLWLDEGERVQRACFCVPLPSTNHGRDDACMSTA